MLVSLRTRCCRVDCLSLPQLRNKEEAFDYCNEKAELAFLRYLDELHPDIIHFHAMQNIGANLIPAAKKRGYPTVLTMHDFWWICPRFFLADANYNSCGTEILDLMYCEKCLHISGRDDFIELRLHYLSDVLKSYCDLIVTVSQFQYNKVVANVEGLRLEQIIVLPNGVDAKAQHKQRNPQKVVFGFFGGTSKLKGYDVLMKAIDLLNDAGEQYEVLLYGGDTHRRKNLIEFLRWGFSLLKKPLLSLKKAKLKCFHAKNKVKNHLTLLPIFSSTEKEHVYTSIDVSLVLSTVQESFSLVAHESLAYQVPIILTKCGGPEYLFDNADCGILIDCNDEVALAKAMQEICHHPEQLVKYQSNISQMNFQTSNMQTSEIISYYEQLSPGH